jgi:hypothetical protein
MPRPVAIRASYDSDAAFLLRLTEAVGKDSERHSAVWIDEVQISLRKAANLFLGAREDEKKKRGNSRHKAAPAA